MWSTVDLAVTPCCYWCIQTTNSAWLDLSSVLASLSLFHQRLSFLFVLCNLENDQWWYSFQLGVSGFDKDKTSESKWIMVSSREVQQMGCKAANWPRKDTWSSPVRSTIRGNTVKSKTCKYPAEINRGSWGSQLEFLTMLSIHGGVSHGWFSFPVPNTGIFILWDK